MNKLSKELVQQLTAKGFSSMLINTMTEEQAQQALKTKKAVVSQGAGSSLMQSAADYFTSALGTKDSVKASFSETADAIGMGQLFNYFGSFTVNDVEVIPETKLDVKFLCELDGAKVTPSEKFSKNRLLEGVKVGAESIIYKEWSARGKRVISSHIFKDGLLSQFNKNKYGMTATYYKDDKTVILVTRADIKA